MKSYTFFLPVAVLFVLIIIYWYLIFELVDQLLEKQRLTKLLRLPVGIFNAFFVFLLSALIGGNMIPYLFVIILSLLDFKIFYKDTFSRNLFCTAICLIHVLSFRAITSGAISMASGLSIYEISNNPTMYAYSVVITFVFLIIALLLTLKLVPLYRVKAVNGHSDQQFFMLSWMIVNIAYLLFNSAAAEDPVFHMGMVENQIVAPCVILIGTYIILLFAIRTGELIGYKEKNAELELTVSKEQEYRSSFTKDALLTYEFNLTRNFITSGFENAKGDLGDMIYRYSDMLSYRTRRYIHPDDMQDFARFASPSNITKEFERGKSEITIEYRRLESENNYIWCRAVTNLARDSENGDIRGFTYVKDIDAEKRCQIELQYKAERDSLTGLYNKGITGKLIAEHLLFNHSHTASAFFMIDIDNFKDINDHFGHAYGDMVLCELSKKLLRIFRPDDIVGRIGGDEYIVYMKNGATDAVVREKGKKICDAFLSSYQDMYGQKYVLSSSVGVAVSPKDGTTFEELYTHADTALYAAKNDGKNCCQIYNGENFSGYQSDRT